MNRLGPGLGALTLLAAGAAAAAIGLPNEARGSHASRGGAPTAPTLASAGEFLRREVREKTEGRWAAAWGTLYPAHRRLALRQDFVACERATPFPAELKSLQILRVTREPVVVPGLAQPVAGVGVLVKVELAWYGNRDPITFRHVFHLVPSQGHWTWLLSDERYRVYAGAGCASAPAV
jgi:hypothetical protein